MQYRYLPLRPEVTMKRLSCADSLLLLCVRSTLSTVCILALVYAVLPVIAPAQTLNTLFGFNVNDGDFPVTTLVEGKGGNLYGTTSGGGEHNAGTVFKIVLHRRSWAVHTAGAERCWQSYWHDRCWGRTRVPGHGVRNHSRWLA